MPGPFNDDLANAARITGTNFTYVGGIGGATFQPGEAMAPGANGTSVWFKYTPETHGVLSVTTGPSNFSTILAAYVGPADATDPSHLVPIRFGNTGSFSFGSNISTNVSAGTTYYFAASGVGQQSLGSLHFGQTAGPNGLACYASSTRIETARGLVAVEELRAGDVVRTVSGRHGDHAPVKWIGYRQVDLLRHPRAAKVQPVRFRAGSLGEGLPVRDLVVSPDHCMWIDGALIPAHFLVNGQTIVQETHRATVTYWHVELEQHDVLLAEGAASESYLDTGNRHAFSSGGATEMLHADFEGSDSAERLVPRLPAEGGDVVRAVRARLATREVMLAA